MSGAGWSLHQDFVAYLQSQLFPGVTQIYRDLGKIVGPTLRTYAGYVQGITGHFVAR